MTTAKLKENTSKPAIAAAIHEAHPVKEGLALPEPPIDLPGPTAGRGRYSRRPEPRTTPLKLLRLPEVQERTGLRHSQIFAAVRDGRFPRPIRVLEGGRAMAWLEEEINDYIRERVAARDLADA